MAGRGRFALRVLVVLALCAGAGGVAEARRGKGAKRARKVAAQAVASSSTVVGAQAALEIVVLRPAGVRAYQEVTDEFAEACRVRARVHSLGEPLVVGPQSVVLAVGQRALEAVLQTQARVVSALSLHVPAGVLAADAVPPPELLLRALKAARPSVRKVVVVHGPRTAALVDKSFEPARALGIELLPARGEDGPGALRALHASSERADAVWLAPDVDVLAPQLFQYALALQIRRGLPIVGASRQQVKSGALLSLDADPRAVGRQAAALVNELLAGVPVSEVAAQDRTGSLQLMVNGEVARRLAVDLAALRALGAEVE